MPSASRLVRTDIWVDSCLRKERNQSGQYSGARARALLADTTLGHM